jgi:hypothetical protein
MACGAVRPVANRRILEGEAPALPVEGCTEKRCQCRFQHYTDRRNDDDRRNPFGNSTALQKLHENDEHRATDDRREERKDSRPRAYFNDHQP